MNTQHTLLQSDTTESKSFALQLQQTTSNISVSEDDHINSDKRPIQPSIATEDIVFEQNGYRKIRTICTTSQGQLYKAYQFSNDQHVAIKQTDKLLHVESVAIQDEATFCVSENIVKEAMILQYLTVDNKCIGGYVVKFIDFFESVTNYYLVIEYIESEMNLKQFVNSSHKYIKEGKLQMKDYQRTIKYLYWQLCCTVEWLHQSMNCAHLDLNLENIMIVNGDFLQVKNDCYKINPKVAIRLVDFGVSEVWTDHSFKCCKQGLSLDNESYAAPKVYSGDDIYDAGAADMWSLGMMLFYCIAGNYLYKPMDIWQCTSLATSEISLATNGYWAVHNNQLQKYVKVKNIKTFNNSAFDFLNNLLNTNEDQRLNAMGILKHKWFAHYYNSYHIQIEKKKLAQRKHLEKQKDKLRNFPFYRMIVY